MSSQGDDRIPKGLSNAELEVLLDSWEETWPESDTALAATEVWFVLVDPSRPRDVRWAGCARLVGGWLETAHEYTMALGATMAARSVFLAGEGDSQFLVDAAECLDEASVVQTHVDPAQAVSGFVQAGLEFVRIDRPTRAVHCLNNARRVCQQLEMNLLLRSPSSWVRLQSAVESRLPAWRNLDKAAGYFLLGVIFLHLGGFERARASLAMAVDQYRSEFSRNGSAMGRSGLQAWLDAARDYAFSFALTQEAGTAVKVLWEAVAQCAPDVSQTSRVGALLELATLLSLSGEYRGAANTFSAVISDMGGRADKEAQWIRAAALGGLGDVRYRMQRYSGSVEAYQRCEDALKAVGGYDRVVAEMSVQRGQAISRIDPARAVLVLETSLGNLRESVGALDALALAHDVLANCREVVGDPQHALAERLAACDYACLARWQERQVFYKDFEIVYTGDPVPPTVRLLLSQAAEAAAQGDHEAEASMKTQALLLSERIRSPRLRAELGRNVVSAGPTLAQIDPDQLEMLSRVRSEYFAERQERAEKMKDSLGAETDVASEASASELVELEREVFGPKLEPASLLSIVVPSIEELTQALGPDEGMVCYLRDGGDLISILVDSSGVTHTERLSSFYVQADEWAVTDLQKSIEAMEQIQDDYAREVVGFPTQAADPARRMSLRLRTELTTLRPILEQLGKLLLKPVMDAGWLTDDAETRKKRLTFIPTHSLFGVPFAALRLALSDESDGAKDSYRYLVELAEVTMLPQAFGRVYQNDKEPTVKEQRTLAVLDPASCLDKAEIDKVIDGLSKGHVPGEVIEFRDQGRNGGPVTPDNFLKVTRGYRSLVVMAHGSFDEKHPLLSGLELANASDGSRLLTAGELFAYPEVLGLIVLLACQSGKFKVAGVDEIQGLSRAALYISKYVSSGLWRLRSDAASAFLQEVWAALRRGEDPVSATASAQRAFLKKTVGVQDSDHPFLWAGFQVLG